MSSQKKLSKSSVSNKEIKIMAEVLDLEKKYFDILWSIFSSDNFKNDLIIIEENIQNNYLFLERTWKLKNKLKIPVERLARQYIYKELAKHIKGIYPSPVSSDIAFITEDAVVNLDVKTLDINGNKNDICYLQFENNQSTFENINLDADPQIYNSGVRVECILPQEYVYKNDNKIMLTYFLVIVYNDDSKSFNLSNNNIYPTIQLKCLPNGLISTLFDKDIVQNFKTYKYFKKEDGFKPIFLTKDKNKVKDKIKSFVANNTGYVLIEGRTKLGVFSNSMIHPHYNKYGISFFPVNRKDKGFYLEAVKHGNTIRVRNNILKERFDSNDNKWLGIKTITI